MNVHDTFTVVVNNKTYDCSVQIKEHLFPTDAVSYNFMISNHCDQQDDDVVDIRKQRHNEAIGFIELRQTEDGESTQMAASFTPIVEPLIPYTVNGDDQQLIAETVTPAVEQLVRFLAT